MQDTEVNAGARTVVEEIAIQKVRRTPLVGVAPSLRAVPLHAVEGREQQHGDRRSERGDEHKQR